MIFKPNEAVIIAGLSIRTTNENNQSAIDIPALWNRFMAGNFIEVIPHKTDNTIYCLYTDYEKDHTRPYSTFLGCRVSHIGLLPEGITAKSFTADKYHVFTAKGKINDGIVFYEWLKIWSSPLKRKFTTDIEVYGATARDINNAEIPILVAIE